MKVLIFDTETTGLPKSKASAYAGPNNWPHIVSISWIVLNSETNKFEKVKSFIVRPEKWIIPPESTAIHGISHELAMQSGLPLLDVMYEFLLEERDIIVSHNYEFDNNVVINALKWDLEVPNPVLKGIPYCTMKLTTNFCKLPGKYYGYKPPKLKELYKIVFGRDPDESKLHGSLYDAQILAEIIKEFGPLRRIMGLDASRGNTTDGLQASRTLHIDFSDSK